jgi:hypothetical protein
VSELVGRDADVTAALHASHRDGIDALIDLVSHTPRRLRLLRLQNSCRFEQSGEGPGALPSTHTQGKLALTIG